MKKCPVCNRTYSDETLSFCLEDGSLLSAPFNLQEEQETVVRPNLSGLPPTQFYSPPTAAQQEIPTRVSAKNELPADRQADNRILNPSSSAFSAGKTFKKIPLGWPLFVLFVLVLAAIYTGSKVPLIAAFFAALSYLIYRFMKLFIKRN